MKIRATLLVAAGLGLAALLPVHAQTQALRQTQAQAEVQARTPAQVQTQDGARWRGDHHRRPVWRPLYPAYGDGFDPRTSTARRVTCNSVGNCTVTYYDPRYDRRAYRQVYAPSRHRVPVRYWDGYRWRTRDR